MTRFQVMTLAELVAWCEANPPLTLKERLAETTDNGPAVEQYREPEYTLTVEEAMRRHDLSPIIRRFGTWAVTTYGIECLAAYYPIERKRLHENKEIGGWVKHLYGKRWVILGDFKAAFDFACKSKTASNLLKTRYEIFKRDGFRCQICGRNAKEDGVKLELGHKIARANGGTYDHDNLWTLCFDCNRGQGDDNWTE
jgi:hypothetical protein